MSPQIDRELPDNITHSVERFLERKNQGITFGDADFIQRYFQKQAGVLVHFYARDVRRELVALFQREGDTGDSKPLISVPLIPERRQPSDCRDSSPRCYKEVVLIDVVKAMKTPEFVVPSRVWIGIPDELYKIIPDALYLSAKESFVIRGNRRVIEDWERVPVRDLVIGAHESNDKIVQGRTEILKNISGEQPDFWGDGLSLDDMEEWLSALRISLYEHSVWIRSSEGIKFNFELVDSLFGPLDL